MAEKRRASFLRGVLNRRRQSELATLKQTSAEAFPRDVKYILKHIHLCMARYPELDLTFEESTSFLFCDC
jgi:hypothetical protein